SRISILVICLIGSTLSAQPAAAGPFDFLKRIGRSITHPHHTPVPRRTTRKSSAQGTAADDTNRSADDDRGAPGATKGPQPAVETPPSAEPPKVVTERPASGVPPAQVARADLPYGVPVPSRPGFVVSPYSPGGGYVDIRGFPSGTAVKDPYTGKIFLTP
ncbi:MAG TPA: hypothetical protein VGQ82_04275, partial [Chthoniobacterales bacterium]|nr:hypothetical protein [Chthoniobacterales bacterium]